MYESFFFFMELIQVFFLLLFLFILLSFLPDVHVYTWVQLSF